MAHTCFASTEEEAVAKCEEMKVELSAMVEALPVEGEAEVDEGLESVTQRISEFVERFP